MPDREPDVVWVFPMPPVPDIVVEFCAWLSVVARVAELASVVLPVFPVEPAAVPVLPEPLVPVFPALLPPVTTEEPAAVPVLSSAVAVVPVVVPVPEVPEVVWLDPAPVPVPVEAPAPVPVRVVVQPEAIAETNNTKDSFLKFFIVVFKLDVMRFSNTRIGTNNVPQLRELIPV